MRSLIKAKSVGSPACEEIFIIASEAAFIEQTGMRREKVLSPEEKAQMIINQAREDAAAIIEQAKLQAESIRTQLEQQGFQAGLQQLDAERQQVAETAANIQADAEAQIAEYWKSIEPEMLKLSVDIARKILRTEIPENKETVINTVKAGLHQLRDRREIKIRINSANFEFMREHKDDITAAFDGIQNVELIEDRRVDEGGCIIESQNGHLDGRIETQLKETERALLEASHDGISDSAEA